MTSHTFKRSSRPRQCKQCEQWLVVNPRTHVCPSCDEDTKVASYCLTAKEQELDTYQRKQQDLAQRIQKLKPMIAAFGRIVHRQPISMHPSRVNEVRL